MTDSEELSDPYEFLAALPFVQEFGIEIVSVAHGAVTVEMPFSKRFSTPPNNFPASVVGTIGDVAAVSSCLSMLPRGWAAATLDYTIKMTGQAAGDKLRAKGKVLQSGKTISVAYAEVFAVAGAEETEMLCGSLQATTRNFRMKV